MRFSSQYTIRMYLWRSFANLRVFLLQGQEQSKHIKISTTLLNIAWRYFFFLLPKRLCVCAMTTQSWKRHLSSNRCILKMLDMALSEELLSWDQQSENRLSLFSDCVSWPPKSKWGVGCPPLTTTDSASQTWGSISFLTSRKIYNWLQKNLPTPPFSGMVIPACRITNGGCGRKP
jgi:hypothetical protein